MTKVMELIQLDDIWKVFQSDSGPQVHAVNGVSLSIFPGETYGLIGESGSGKSTLGRILLGLLRPDKGTVRFEGRDLLTLSKQEQRDLRSQISVVFQEPYESLNPRMTVDNLISEPLLIQGGARGSVQIKRKIDEVLEKVNLDHGLKKRYPRELSGGQQQRVGIARAIITDPRLMVLDEPTSSLDVSVRAQILTLLSSLQEDLGVAYLFISHDIHTVEWISQRIGIMYLGCILETGSTSAIFANPAHPYTKALISSRLSTDPSESSERQRLKSEIPSSTVLPTGCTLCGRCPIEIESCSQGPVAFRDISSDHRVACIRVETSTVRG